MSSEEDKTVWVGNLSDQVEEDILFELFLQAGPLHYVKLPRDKATGRKKNFAFICFRHECSVPYAIELMDDIKLYGRNMKVQSRHLQELQSQGLVPYGSGGIHTLNPLEETKPSQSSKSCHQQAAMMPPPSSLLGKFPGHPLGNVPPHILALAQQQMAVLNASQMTPLSANPLLNARMKPRDDRFGSINYGSNSPNSSRYEHQRYDRYQDNKNRDGRGVDNKTMQAIKSRFDDNELVAHNSHMVADLQERHGRFDRNRLGASGHNNDSRHRYDRDDSSRSVARDYRQQPYSRQESHHSRSNDRRSSHDSHRKHNDGSSGYRGNNYNRGHYNSYNSRR